MFRQCKIKLTGIGPMLQHNPNLGDKLHSGTKAIAAVTSKKVKTDADLHKISELEFTYGLYMSPKDGPIIPVHVAKGVLGDAARKLKLGKEVKAGIEILGHTKLEYKGPRTAPEMYKSGATGDLPSGTFVDIQMKKQQGKLVRRTRPKFDNWSATMDIEFNDEIISESNIDQILAMVPRCGIGDDRPGTGKLTAKRI